MATFTETKTTLDAIARKTNNLRQNNDALLTKATAIEADLQAMQSQYSAFVTQLDVDAANNAGDAAWDDAKAQKDELQSDFIAERNRAASIVTALTGL